MLEMGLTLLVHALMSIIFLDHSFTIDFYLINRFPTSVLRTYNSPYQVVFDKQLGYASFKTFGCACFLLIIPYKKQKLEFRST